MFTRNKMEEVQQEISNIKAALDDISQKQTDDCIKLGTAITDLQSSAGLSKVIDMLTARNSDRSGDVKQILKVLTLQNFVPFSGNNTEQFNHFMTNLEKNRATYSLNDSQMRGLALAMSSECCADFLIRTFETQPNMTWADLKTLLKNP